MPPDHWFEREPVGKIVVRALLEAETAAYCTAAVSRGTGKRQFEDMGCSLPIPGIPCLVTINADLAADVYAALLRHETAHCYATAKPFR